MSPLCTWITGPRTNTSHPFHSSCSPRPFKIIHGAVICSDPIQPENALKTMIKCDNMVTSEWHSIALLSLPTGKVSGNSSKDRLMDRSCCLIVFCAGWAGWVACTAWGSLWRAMEFRIGPYPKRYQTFHLTQKNDFISLWNRGDESNCQWLGSASLK